MAGNGLAYWGPGGSLSAAISLALGNTLPDISATIPSTFTRATTDDGVKDYEGILRQVPAGAHRAEGRRIIENLVTDHSEDLTIQPSGPKANTSVTATTITGTGTNNSYRYIRLLGSADVQANHTYAARVKVQYISGDTSVGIGLISDVGQSATADLSDGLEHVYYFEITVNGTSDIWIRADNRINSGGPFEIAFTEYQLEDITGRVRRAPSEYVSKGVGVGDELLTTAVTASDWTVSGTNTVADNGDGSVKVTYVDNATGATLDLGALLPRIESTARYHVIKGRAKVDSGDSVNIVANNESPAFSQTITSTTFVPFHIVATYDGSGNFEIVVNSMGAGETIDIEIESVKSASHLNAGDSGGIKFFDTYNANTVSSNIVTEATGATITASNNKFAVLPGGTTDSYTTADSLTFTGSFEVIAYIVPSDLTTGIQIVASQDASGARSWEVGLFGGQPYLLAKDSAGGAFINGGTGTVLSQGNGAGRWVKWKYTHATTGNVAFDAYESDDPVSTDPEDVSNWSAVGTQQTTAATGNALNSVAIDVMVGNRAIPTTRPFIGRIYKCAFYNESVSLANREEFFDANDAGSWTANGNAYIYEPGAPTGVICYPALENLHTHSEDLSNAAWTKANATITADQFTAPDGALTMDKLGDDSATGTGAVTAADTVTVTSTNKVTACGYFKADQLTHAYIATSAFDAAGNGTSWVNLSTLAKGTTSANHFALAQALPDGIVRFGITFSTTTDLTGDVAYGVADADNDTTVDRDGTSSIGAWGFMCVDGWDLETQGFPPYVATVASTVTRNADISNWSTLAVDASAGLTLWAEITTGDVVADGVIAQLDDGGSTDVFKLEIVSGALTGTITSSAGNNVSITGSALSANTTYKVALAASADDAQLYLDGVSDGTDVTYTDITDTLTTLRALVDESNASQPGQSLNSVKAYTQRLTTAQVAAL